MEFRGCGGKANVFKNIIFEKKVDFVYSQFIHFSHIVFKDNLRFYPEENQTKKTIFHKVDFGKDVQLPANSIPVTCKFWANYTNCSDESFYKCTFNKAFIISEGKYTDKSLNIQLTRCQINNLKFLTPHNYTNLTFNKSNFPNELNLNKQIFSGDIKFINCVFKDKANFEQCQFNANVDFLHCVFEKELNFEESRFAAENSKNQKIDFSHSIFKERVNFSGVKFLGDIYFHRAIFEKDLQIYGAYFAKIVNFNFAVFKDLPNFSASIFENPKKLNFIGINISALSLETIKKYIEKITKDNKKQNDEKNNDKSNEELNLYYAQYIRDSFRVIKDALLAQNNLLEAQIWHKLELFTKELELNYQLELENKKIKEKERKKGNNIFERFCRWFKGQGTPINKGVSAFVDSMLLAFYRVTSEHHSDFTRILNFTFTMVVIYGGLLWLIGQNYTLNYFQQILEASQEFYLFIIFLAILFSLVLYAKIVKESRKNYLYICFLFIFIAVVVFLNMMKDFINYSSLALLLYIALLAFAIFLYRLKLMKKDWFTYSFHYLIYIGFVLIIIQKPQLINPFIGVFKSDDLIQTHFFKKQLNEASKIQILALSQIMVDKNYALDLNQINALNDDLKNVNLNDSKTLSEARVFILNDKERLNFILETFEKNLKDDNETIKQNAIKTDKELNLSKFSSALQKDEILKSAVQSTSVLYSIVLLLCLFSLIKTGRKNSIIPA